MSAIYDNWESLMDAVLKKEQYKQLCLAESRSPSTVSESSENSSSFSSRSPLHDVSGPSGSSSTFGQHTENAVPNEPVFMQGVVSNPDLHAMNAVSDKKKLTIFARLTKLGRKLFRRNDGIPPLRQQLSSSSSIIFKAKDLQKATNDYADNKLLGHGGYGTMYKGILQNNQLIAIKRLLVLDESRIEEFTNEVIILSQINHRNIVKLLGCCLETKVPLLVYEYVSNNTLLYHINEKNPRLTWVYRVRIAREVAGALAYLHNAASVPIIHRDVKSSDILLDDNDTAKVSGFENSILVPMDQRKGLKTVVRGTLGYLDPEYVMTSRVTEKSDVYSFGVVLAELITGRRAISLSETGEATSLATLFSTALQENQLFQMLDPLVRMEGNLEQIHCVAELANRCLSLHGVERPTMKEVALELITRFQGSFLQEIKEDSTIQNEVPLN